MKIVVDSVGLSNKNDSSCLNSALIELRGAGCAVVVLDRGAFLSIDGCEVIPFPSYERDRVNSADSEMLQRFCDHCAGDIFFTCAWTTPLMTPGVRLVFGASQPASSVQERNERRLCAKYCHASFVMDNKDALQKDDVALDIEEHRASSLEEVLCRKVYPSSFYMEWARLRRLQSALDVKLWSDYAHI